ncbi:MAG: arsenate reductase ArsC [Thermoplasmatota archaeon]
MKRRVLFVCTHNSARSQMGEALLRQYGGDRYEALSAGIEPTHVNPNAVAALREIGIDTSVLRSKSVDEYIDTDIDLVITVCDNAKEACPFFPGGKERIHRGFRDPSDLVDDDTSEIDAFRIIRDEIREFIDGYFQ